MEPRADPILHVSFRMSFAKRDGLPFDRAWRVALRSLPPRPRAGWDRIEHDAAVRALHDTRGAWERAYRDEEPSPEDSAAIGLLDRFGLESDPRSQKSRAIAA